MKIIKLESTTNESSLRSIDFKNRQAVRPHKINRTHTKSLREQGLYTMIKESGRIAFTKYKIT